MHIDFDVKLNVVNYVVVVKSVVSS